MSDKMNTMIDSSLREVLKSEFGNKGVDMDSFPKEQSLILAGIIDSMTFVNILLEMEIKTGVSLDFTDADMKSIASFNGIKDFFINSMNGSGGEGND